MFYSVEVSLGILVGGFFLGVLLGRIFEHIQTRILASAYYSAIAVLLVLGFLANTLILLFGPSKVWAAAAGVCGSLATLLMGCIFGLASRRREPFDLIGERQILSATLMSVSFTFALAGLGKAFTMVSMMQFFADPATQQLFSNSSSSPRPSEVSPSSFPGRRKPLWPG